MSCPPHAQIYDEACLRKDLEILRDGVKMEIPNDVEGGTMTVIVEVGVLGWAADLLGAHGLGPWPESFSARHCCRDCWWHSSCWCAHVLPGSREAKSKRPHAEGCRGERVLRTDTELQKDLNEGRARTFKSKKALTDFLRDKGISKMHCALLYLPDSRPSSDLGADIQHIFLLGERAHFLLRAPLSPSPPFITLASRDNSA